MQCWPVTESWFLKIDGIEGESTAASHQGEIDVLSWAWGLSVPDGGSGGGGGRARRPEFREFRFTTRISKASPPLLEACATGRRIRSVELSGVRPHGGPRSSDFLAYRLGDAIVTGVEHTDAEAELPTEQFSLAYATIEISYTPQDPTGRLGEPVVFRFDLQNRL